MSLIPVNVGNLDITLTPGGASNDRHIAITLRYPHGHAVQLHLDSDDLYMRERGDFNDGIRGKLKDLTNLLPETPNIARSIDHILWQHFHDRPGGFGIDAYWGFHCYYRPVTRAPAVNRHHCSREKLKEIGDCIREIVQAKENRNNIEKNESIQSLVEYLNDVDATRSVIDNFPDFINRAIVHCDCGHFEDANDTYGRDTVVCESCHDSGTYVYCADDCEYHHVDDATYVPSRECYYTQEGADDLNNDDDDDDGDDEDHPHIYQWGANSVKYLSAPEIVSSSEGDFTLGMEFECVPANAEDRTDFAEELADEFAGTIICKEDGSLPANGLELVFAPLTLTTLKKTWCSVSFPDGTQAWQAAQCGTHIHIDSRAFTRLSLAKFVAFWNAPQNAHLIRQVAGRHPLHDAQARQYAATVEPSPDAKSIVGQLKNGELNLNRYRAVNLTALSPAEQLRLGLNFTRGAPGRIYDTVELRIFRASLRRERTLAQIEMTHATVMYAREGSIGGMTAAAFSGWLQGHVAQYPYLAAWLGHRKTPKLKPGHLPPTQHIARRAPAHTERELEEALA